MYYVENRPITCTFCGTLIRGREVQIPDRIPGKYIVECHWTCGQCGQLVRSGQMEPTGENIPSVD